VTNNASDNRCGFSGRRGFARCRRYRAGCGSDLLFIRNLVAEKRPQPSGLVPFRGWRRPSSLRGGRRNRSPRMLPGRGGPQGEGERIQRSHARWCMLAADLPPPPPPPPFPAERAIPPTIGAANTFPGTRVMILLYYANYAVAAHGQWCILMAIVAQRGAIAIDQSCSGYANSRAQPAERGTRRATRRWRGLTEDDGNARTATTRTKRYRDVVKGASVLSSFCMKCTR